MRNGEVVSFQVGRRLGTLEVAECVWYSRLHIGEGSY